MPYTVKQKENGKWCVYNKETGENMGESPTREQAVAHMRALYANAPEAS